MEVENITKQYVVPMSSGVHVEYPQHIRQRKMIHKQPFYNVVDTTSLGQEKVIEQMSGADGTASQNTQVKALEDLIKNTTNRKDELNKLISQQRGLIDNAQSNYDTFNRYTTGCKKKLRGFTPTYECQDGHQVIIKTHEAELKQKSEWEEKLRQYNITLQNYLDELDRIDKDLPKLQSNLAKAREDAAVAAMTPEQKTQYEASQKQAEAQAQATVIEAEARAASTKSKSKVVLIVGIVLGVALLAGLTFYLMKGRKKGVPAPVAPVVK